jgi:PEP-CTERM motif
MPVVTSFRYLSCWIRRVVAALLLACAAIAPATAQNMVTNGTFVTAYGPQASFTPAEVTGWSSTSGSNFVYVYSAATASSLFLSWAGSTGSPNTWNGTTPDGTNFAGLYGVLQTGPISQTITGLTKGKTYTFSFIWALAQIAGLPYADTGYLTATLEGSTYTTSTASIPGEGFSGWFSQTYTYVATSATAHLAFSASGTGAPPYLLLADVSLTQQGTGSVPEPASLALLGSGVAAMLGLARRRAAAARAA